MGDIPTRIDVPFKWLAFTVNPQAAPVQQVGAIVNLDHVVRAEYSFQLPNASTLRIFMDDGTQYAITEQDAIRVRDYFGRYGLSPIYIGLGGPSPGKVTYNPYELPVEQSITTQVTPTGQEPTDQATPTSNTTS